MPEPTTFLVQCSQCEAVFPIKVELTPASDEEETSAVEKECPNCGTLLQFELPGHVAEDASVFKGFPKVDE